MFEFYLKQTDLLDENRTAFVINGLGMKNNYCLRVVEEYKRAENLNEYIYVYEKEKEKKIALIANLEDSANEEVYFNVLTLLFNKIYEVHGRRINVYLPSLTSFIDLARAAMRFCEKNLGHNFVFQFYCEKDNFPILNQVFETLDKVIENRKLEISKFLYNSFCCNGCKKFTYSPIIVNCCNLVFCKACIHINKKCKICFNKIEVDELRKIHRLFESGPYYCFCGEKMNYSERERHCKSCDILWYKCGLCNTPLNYKNSLEHFKKSHLPHLMSEALF